MYFHDSWIGVRFHVAVRSIAFTLICLHGTPYWTVVSLSSPELERGSYRQKRSEARSVARIQMLSCKVKPKRSQARFVAGIKKMLCKVKPTTVLRL